MKNVRNSLNVFLLPKTDLIKHPKLLRRLRTSRRVVKAKNVAHIFQSMHHNPTNPNRTGCESKHRFIINSWSKKNTYGRSLSSPGFWRRGLKDKEKIKINTVITVFGLQVASAETRGDTTDTKPMWMQRGWLKHDSDGFLFLLVRLQHTLGMCRIRLQEMICLAQDSSQVHWRLKRRSRNLWPKMFIFHTISPKCSNML